MSIIVATIAIFISVVLYLKQKKRKEISYAILSKVQLLSVKSEIKEKVTILFEDKPTQQVHLAEILIFNSGNISVVKEDFKRPISLGFGNKAQILSAEITETSPENLEAEDRIQGKKVVLKLELFNSNDSVLLKMLVSRLSDIKVDGRIVGIKKINEFRRKEKRYILPIFFGMAVEFLGFYVLVFLDHILGPSDIYVVSVVAFAGAGVALVSIILWLVPKIRDPLRKYRVHKNTE